MWIWMMRLVVDVVALTSVMVAVFAEMTLIE